jgi:hypothetical protein
MIDHDERPGLAVKLVEKAATLRAAFAHAVDSPVYIPP